MECFRAATLHGCWFVHPTSLGTVSLVFTYDVKVCSLFVGRLGLLLWHIDKEKTLKGCGDHGVCMVLAFFL